MRGTLKEELMDKIAREKGDGLNGLINYEGNAN